jgi:hypothetical protein
MRDNNVPLTEYEERVQRLLLPMNVPAFRRDVSQPANVRWLIRNLGSLNSKRAAFKETVRELVRLHRAFKLRDEQGEGK